MAIPTVVQEPTLITVPSAEAITPAPKPAPPRHVPFKEAPTPAQRPAAQESPQPAPMPRSFQLVNPLRRPEGGMNSKPTMLELKESGEIENHSHVVLLPFLPVGDDGGPRPEEQLLIIGKNRNGRIGSLPVYFDEKRLQFCGRVLGEGPDGKP